MKTTTTKIQDLKEGVTIMTPWGKDADKRPVTFTWAGFDSNDDDEDMWTISYIDENGKAWNAFVDSDTAEVVTL